MLDGRDVARQPILPEDGVAKRVVHAAVRAGPRLPVMGLTNITATLQYALHGEVISSSVALDAPDLRKLGEEVLGEPADSGRAESTATIGRAHAQVEYGSRVGKIAQRDDAHRHLPEPWARLGGGVGLRDPHPEATHPGTCEPARGQPALDRLPRRSAVGVKRPYVAAEQLGKRSGLDLALTDRYELQVHRASLGCAARSRRLAAADTRLCGRE